jgi:hypothetical protein
LRGSFVDEDDGGDAMDRLEAQARGAVRGLGRRRRTQRIPDGVRERVAGYAREARARGVSLRRIAKAVGLSASGVQRFAQAKRAERRAPLVRVVVPVPSAEPLPTVEGLRLVTPSGHCLERLSLAQALELLRALG